jgi:hypothetical protein
MLSCSGYTSYAQSTSAVDPARAYWEYLDSIARRDVDAVLEALTYEYGYSLHQFRRSRGFDVFFNLWCESESQPVVVTGSNLMGDRAIVHSRGKSTLSRILMRWIDGKWRIGSERHACVYKVNRLDNTGTDPPHVCP